MSREHVEAACNLIDPEHAGLIPEDTVLVQDVIRLLSTQLAEVDRLTLDHATEVLGLKSNAAAVRIQHDQRVELLRGTIDRLTRELAAAQQSLIEAGTEHARDLGHLADRNRELETTAARAAHAENELDERTRERDDAKRMYCEAVAVGETDVTCTDVEQLRGIAAGTWCGAEARRLYPETTEEPQP